MAHLSGAVSAELKTLFLDGGVSLDTLTAKKEFLDSLNWFRKFDSSVKVELREGKDLYAL